MGNRRLKIYMGDLVHDWEKVGLWTFPINLGFVGGYAAKQFPGELDIRLFKRPEALIAAIKDEAPDVLALSFYVWNTRLNAQVMKVAKTVSPATLTIGGGPHFTDININDSAARHFFSLAPDCDAYVLNQGEAGFAAALRRFSDGGNDVGRFRAAPVEGLIVQGEDGTPRLSRGLPALTDLNDIPSPYLSGMLDAFFDGPYTPQIETNRSCPFRCTFCAWGIGTKKLAQFDVDRVRAEIEYIAKRCTNAMDLMVCDANFGILPRDVDIAGEMARCHEKFGYPGHVSAQWSKAKPERVMDVASKLGGLSEITGSLQSTNEKALEAIKRRNLPLERVVELSRMQQRDNGAQIDVFSELILGLPEETKASHIEANRYLIDMGVESVNYNLHLLPGTEMDTPESRQRYFKRTGWRMHDGCYGVYDGVKVIEGQEVVMATSTMSELELRSFRFIHFLLQMMWGRRHFIDYLRLLQNYGIHPLDVVLRVDQAARSDKGPVGDLFRAFDADHEKEGFDSYEALWDYWTEDGHWQRLREGTYGKLNYHYTVEVLVNCFGPFADLLGDVGRELLNSEKAPESAFRQCREILDFCRMLRLEVTDDFDLVDEKQGHFTYDFVSWRNSGRQGVPAAAGGDHAFRYDFYLDGGQRQNLERQLRQYRNRDVSTTIRAMSVYIKPDDMLYKARLAA